MFRLPPHQSLPWSENPWSWGSTATLLYPPQWIYFRCLNTLTIVNSYFHKTGNYLFNMLFYYIIFISYFSFSPSPSRSFPPPKPPNFKFFLKEKTQYSNITPPNQNHAPNNKKLHQTITNKSSHAKTGVYFMLVTTPEHAGVVDISSITLWEKTDFSSFSIY